MSKPILGAQLYTVRDYCKTLEDTVKTLAKIKAIGYRAVQLSGVGPMNSDPEGLAKAIKDSGLDACCTHVSFDLVTKETDKCIAMHKAWGVRHVAIGSVPPKYKLTLDGIKEFVDDMAAAVPKLADAGMDFSYHNHSFEFFKIADGRTWLQALYETAPADILKAELDVHWVAAGGGSPATWIRALGRRQPLLHLKDFVIARTSEEKIWDIERRFCPIGSGNLDWPDVFKAAEEVGVEYMLVEQDNCYGKDPFDELAASYRFVTSMGYN